MQGTATAGANYDWRYPPPIGSSQPIADHKSPTSVGKVPLPHGTNAESTAADLEFVQIATTKAAAIAKAR